MRVKKNQLTIIVAVAVLVMGGVGFGIFQWLKSTSPVAESAQAVDSLAEAESAATVTEKAAETPVEPATEDSRLAELRQEKYFLQRNAERYLAYLDLHPDLSLTVAVRYVNSNVDRTKYVDVVEADLSHGVLSMINKYNYLGEYAPADLVDLGSNYGSGYNMLRREAAEAFMRMADAARAEGITLRNISGYRSYAVQDYLYKMYSARDGSALADTYSSRPGYSEHQVGLATDINSVDTDFQYTPEFAWLQAHAADYGFILRYPEELEEITGFSYEPWHYRYVGVAPAQQIVTEGITFDEYYAYYVIGDSDE